VGALLYTALCSHDGYVVDADGSFGWAAPDREVHAHVNDSERAVGTYLLGRRMYEVMRYWEGPDPDDDPDPVLQDYRQMWQAADKVVFSRSLAGVTTERTTLRPAFAVEEVRALVAAADHPVSVGGPTLAGQALAAGLVDEVRLYRFPVLVGGGTAALPAGVRADLELVDLHRFDSGVVLTTHRVRRTQALSG
jgi:dihydrofolate reductase